MELYPKNTCQKCRKNGKFFWQVFLYTEFICESPYISYDFRLFDLGEYFIIFA